MSPDDTDAEAPTPQDEDAGAPEEPAEPLACSACRGTGKVISNLGGTPSEIDCPWCDGSGVSIPEHDAQAARRAERGEQSEPEGGGGGEAQGDEPEPPDQVA